MNQATYENVLVIDIFKLLSGDTLDAFLNLCQKTPGMQYSKDSGLFMEYGFSFLKNPSETERQHLSYYQAMFDTLNDHVSASALFSPLVLHFEW